MPLLRSEIEISFKVTRLFFDEPAVQRRLGKARARFLALAGRDVRQQGQKLLGPPSKKSYPRPAGQPPRVHTSDDRVSLRNIQYHSDGADSVIVGPVALNQVNQRASDLTSEPVPKIQED